MDLETDFRPERPLILIGAGKMGSALLGGWLSAGLHSESVRVIDPSPSPESMLLLERHAIVPNDTLESGLLAGAVIVAVKPAMVVEAIGGVRAAIDSGTVVVSIAAGQRIATIEAAAGNVPVVRAMPNTPAQVRRGITAAVGNSAADDSTRRITTALLEAVGDVVWLDDEELMDAVTAVSGSGPAYVFLMVEAMAKAGEAAGLPPDLAMRLARVTVAGSGELMRLSELDAADLRRNVTSPNGTTAAALNVLMADGGLVDAVERAVAAAEARSKELSG